MPTLAPAERAPAPLGQPLRTNLVNSAVTPQDQVRWQPGGVAFNPFNHGFEVGTEPDFGTFDPCAPTLDDVRDQNTIVEANPVGLYVIEKCSALAGDADALAQRALTRLNNQNSHLLERFLWTGDVAGGAWAENTTHLDNPATLTTLNGGTPASIVRAFEFIIDAFASTLGGERGMIHVPAKLLPHIAASDLGFQQGNTIVTSLGSHLIVPGTGYPGTGPDGAAPSADAAWIFGTSLVEVRLSNPRVIAGEDTMDRSDNTDYAYATQLGMAYFDQQAHVGVQVTLA